MWNRLAVRWVGECVNLYIFIKVEIIQNNSKSTILEACKANGVRLAIDIFKDFKQSKNFEEVCSLFLSVAVILDRADIIQLLLDEGVNINHEDEYGYTCMFNALLSKEMVNFLIDNGADHSHKNHAGDQPLFGVLEWGSYDAANELLKRGASVNEPGKDQKIALHHAAGISDKKLLKKLAAKTKEINHQSEFSETALFNAVVYRNVDLVRILAKFGVDVSVKNSKGYTALDLAVACNADRCKEILSSI